MTKNNTQDVPERCIQAELIVSEQRHMPEGQSSKRGLISFLDTTFHTLPEVPFFPFLLSFFLF